LGVAADSCLSYSRLGFVHRHAPANSWTHVLLSAMDPAVRRRQLVIRGASLVAVISAWMFV